jgi:hypothetical protein
VSRRTRKTYQGMKTRFAKKRVSPHGPIRRLVGDTPMQTLADAAHETLQATGETVETPETPVFDAAIKYSK